MPAYNTSDLYNRIIQQQASEAFMKSCISEESYCRILKAHPDKLYTPNYFVRLALGILTLVAVLFITALGILFFGANSDSTLETLMLLTGIACYVVLELMIKTKKYFNAGVDNVLMFSTVLLIISTFFIDAATSNYTLISGVIAVLCFLICLRFTDAFMAGVSYLAFFVFVFLLYVKIGIIAKASAPLLMMLVSAFVFFIARKIEKIERTIIYSSSINTVKFLTLITFYVSVNYFVVKELNVEMFGLHFSAKSSVPLGWLFWILTIIIPPLYIFFGVAKKDFLFIRTGLILVAATVLTIRQYYLILPAEIVMLIVGVLLISISYFLIKYLRAVKRGYTFQNLHPADRRLLNAEALIIAQTFTPAAKIENNTLYGGGLGGGGGATGNF